MSGFKKLRLDPEFNRNLSQPGPSGSDSARGYPDSSSFSSSTSGGNGGYSGGRNSTGPFRARYSQPKGLPSASAGFSRFSPYYFGKERRTSLKVPLIRARRDDSDSDRPSSRASLNSSIGGDSTTPVTSTTAQRIIETLQNLSTPVTNAAKIRIDQDIKAVQPFFGIGTSTSPYRFSRGGALNRSSGPPKMCSSLLLSHPSPSNQISPTTDQRRLFCIPKMVDAATNTDKEINSTPPPPPQQNKHHSNDYQATPLTGKFSTASSSTGTSKPPIAYGIPVEDSDDEEFHECSSEFTFSNAWSTDIFAGYFSTEKDKSGGKRGPPAQKPPPPPLMNGFKEIAPLKSQAGFSAGASSNLNTFASNSPSHSVLGGNRPAGPGYFAFGASPLKDSSKQGLGRTQEEASSKRKRTIDASDDDEPPSSSSKFSTASAPKFGSSTGVSPSLSGHQSPAPFSFGSVASKPFRAEETSVDKVDTSSTSSPVKVAKEPESKSALPPLTAKSDSSKWKCPTCMVPNNKDVPKCVCCGESNPNAASLPSPVAPTPLPLSMFTGSTNAKKKWRCSTCMIENELDAAACVCCAEKNPNPVAGSEAKKDSNAAAQPTFSFGLKGPSTSYSSSPSTTTFSFGAKPPADSNNSSTFSFGVPSSSPGTNTQSQQSTPNASFKFGVPSPATVKPATPSSLDSKPSEPAAAPPTITFGASSSSSDSLTSSKPSTPSQPPPPSTPATTTTTAPTPSLFGSSLKRPAEDSNNIASKVSNAPSSVFGSTMVPPSASPAAATSTVTTTASSGAPGFVFGMNSPLNPLAPKAAASAPSFSFGGASSTPGTDVTQTSSTTTTSATELPTPSLFASAAGKPTTATTPKTTSASAVFGSGTSSTNFSSGSSGGFSFGGNANAATTTDSQPKPSFSFGGTTPGKQAFSPPSFSFGGSQPTTGFTPSITAPTSVPSQSTLGASLTPTFGFGSNVNPTPSPFGQAQPPATSPPQTAPPTFQFGGSTTPANPANPDTPAQPFSFTPNLNFSAVTPGNPIPFGSHTQPTPNAGSQPPQSLFQFNANPTTPDRGGRQFKRAVRRTKR